MMQDQQHDMFGKSEFDSNLFLSSEDYGNINLSIVDMGVVENFLQDEDTLESPQKLNPQFEGFVPVPQYGPPDTENFPGELNFIVEIKSTETDKLSYLYSALLNRIYVDMGKNFPIHFNWDVAKKNLLYPTGLDLYVRATVVFSNQSQAEKRVERCLQHIHEADNPVNKAIVKNVLRSTRALNTAGVYYCGDPAREDSWFSVVVQLSSPGSHAYKFVCKNSCSSGINRRAIDIIFTLEDGCGTVLGRQSVGARACACPKRDIRRDEKECAKGKRKIKHTGPDNPKKIKLETLEDDDNDDDEIIYLPRIPIKGIKTMKIGLKMMQSVMEICAKEVIKRNDQKALEEYNQCLSCLAPYIDNLEKPPQAP